MSMPRKLPLVVSPTISNYIVGSVLIDGSNFLDLFFISTLDVMQITHSKIKMVTNAFFGIILGTMIVFIRHIVLSITFGESNNF